MLRRPPAADPDAARILFLPCWIALFLASTYLDWEPNLNIPKAPRPRPGRSTAWAGVIVTGLVALGVAFGIAVLPVAAAARVVESEGPI